MPIRSDSLIAQTLAAAAEPVRDTPREDDVNAWADERESRAAIGWNARPNGRGYVAYDEADYDAWQ